MMKQRQKNKHDSSYKKFGKHSDSEEETELFTRNKAPKKEIPTIEKVVEEGDTLQSLAIRYRCTIEDLKRLNNVHKENEIFAKRTIKVPHHPISFALAGVHVSGRSSPNDDPASSSFDASSLSSTLVTLSNGSKAHKLNQIIFNSIILQKPSETAHGKSLGRDEDDELVDEEHVHLLPHEDAPREPIISSSRWKFNGADGDISLKALIFCIIVLIFAVPLIYVFYIAEHPEQYQHHGS